MKVTCLGVNSAFATGTYKKVIPVEKIQELLKSGGDIQAELDKYTELLYDPKYHSNFMLDFNTPSKKRAGQNYRLVLDAGGDVRHGLRREGLSVWDVDDYYFSHPHNDHIGGVESIALSTIFNPFAYNKKDWLAAINKPVVTQALFDGIPIPSHMKPGALGAKSVLKKVWQAAEPGLDTLQGVYNPRLGTYFDVRPMSNKRRMTIPDGDNLWTIEIVQSSHVIGGGEKMPSYGLYFKGSHGVKVFFPTDTLYIIPPQFLDYYVDATVIYQDMETGPRSGVHSHIDDIRESDPEIKKKLLGYHFNVPPETVPGEFMGILKTGDVHHW